MLNGQHITVIIPALNEEKSIVAVIEELPDCIDQVIVVDSDSDDNTAALAANAGALVVRESKRGYGNACLKGIQAAGDTNVFAFVGGGYADYPQQLIKLIKPISLDQADLVLGCRQHDKGQKRGRFAHQQFGTYLACLTIWLIYRKRFEDLGPMRCIRSETLAEINMTDRNYGWTAEMQLKAMQMGATILEVPVQCRKRIGRSKISGTIKGTVLAGCKIFYWIFRLVIFPVSAKS